MRWMTSLSLLLLGWTLPSWGAEPTKWEYAELTYRTVRMAPAEGEEAPRTGYTIRWTNGSDEYEAKSWGEVADKLKLAAFKKDGSPALQRLQVLNQLGKEGWELLSSSSNAGLSSTGSGAGGAGAGNRGGFGGSSTVLLFKRRVQ